MPNKLQVEYVSIDEIKTYENNAKLHPAEQIEQIKESIKEFGFNDPIAIDKDNVIIEGHGRYIACNELGIKEVPIIRLEGLDEEHKKAYMLVHNKLTMNTDFDIELLNDELENIFDIDMSKFDFNIDTLNVDDEVEEVETPEPPKEPKSKLGDIYQLGNHRLMCGDSTDEAQVKKLMNNELADMVFTDPPYGMKKENDGVANDNLNYDDLLEFNKKWIPITFNNLKDNGSWYCWGTDEPLMDIYSNLLKPMQKENKITFRNLITWNKFHNQKPTAIEMMRSYCVYDEKCLFVMCGVQGFNNNSDNYFEGWEPIRSYLESEAKKVGLTAKKLQEICGVGMYAHWFTKSQFTLIPKEHYLKLQEYYKGKAFTKPYDNADSIQKEYQNLKDEYYKTRAYFNNTHETYMTEVWDFETATGEERESAGGHATPKPIALCSRAIKSSSRENEIILDVFGGSGSTLIACEQNNRSCYVMELEPRWVDVIIERWENYTGKKAVKIC